MGLVNEPLPPELQVKVEGQVVRLADAHDLVMRYLEPVRLANITIISKNVKYIGTIGEQEAFKLAWSEIRGIALRAIARGVLQPDDRRKLTVELSRAVDKAILGNKAYDKFKTTVVEGPDPLLEGK